MEGQRLFHALIADIASRILGPPSPTPSRLPQAVAIAVMVVGGGVFVYCLPHHADEQPKVSWDVLKTLLITCGVLSLSLAIMGKWRVSLPRAVVALAALFCCAVLLMIVIACIGIGINYLTGTS